MIAVDRLVNSDGREYGSEGNQTRRMPVMDGFTDPREYALSPAERQYKLLFQAAPCWFDAEKYRYHNWQEFHDIYQKGVRGGIEVPQTPPSDMQAELSSESYIMEGADVNVFLNARYCPPFWHHLKFIKITYVLSGECFFFTKNGKRKTLSAGNFIIVPPDVEQTVFSFHDDDTVANIVIRMSTFENAFSTLLTESEVLAEFFWKALYGRDEGSVMWFQCSSDSRLDQYVLDMFAALEKKVAGSNFLLVSHTLAFLAYALSYYRDKMVSLKEGRMASDKLPIIIRYIRENYNTITLSTLAEHFHKSESYLSRYIKSETGYSLTYLLREFRMKQAGIMLRSSGLSVEEIMLHTGYTDISYFYKAFKKYYGMTPMAYRSQAKIINL